MANISSVKSNILGICLPLFVALSTQVFANGPTMMSGQAAGGSVEHDGGWFLESNMVNLDSSNRFIGNLVATNPGKGPIYLRVNVSRIQLVDGVRKVLPDADGALKAFPQEFVLRPAESFSIRLLADLSKMTNPSQSYYVNVADISNLRPDLQTLKGALVGGYLIAYDAMVSIQRESIDSLTEAHFSLTQATDGMFSLKNLSGQHIYLNRGDACPNANTVLVNCSPVEKFPRQTMLPGETLSFPAFKAPVLGMLAYPKLNIRRKASLLYLNSPGAQ